MYKIKDEVSIPRARMALRFTDMDELFISHNGICGRGVCRLTGKTVYRLIDHGGKVFECESEESEWIPIEEGVCRAKQG